MERISANGETYVKASSIARELGYTADYVGQLCRGGHVDAQLVGRSWYVNEASIRAHKRNRYRSSAAKSKAAVREQVEQRSVRTPMNVQVHARTATAASPRYESDEGSLLPSIHAKAPAPVMDIKAPSETSPVTLRRIETEVEEVVEEPEAPTEAVQATEEEVREIPLRRGSALTVRARKMREEALHRQQTPLVSPIKAPTRQEESSTAYPAHHGGQWALVGVSFVTAAAIVTSIALIGFESRSIADSTGSYTAYELNFASAIEAVE